MPTHFEPAPLDCVWKRKYSGKLLQRCPSERTLGRQGRWDEQNGQYARVAAFETDGPCASIALPSGMTRLVPALKRQYSEDASIPLSNRPSIDPPARQQRVTPPLPPMNIFAAHLLLPAVLTRRTDTRLETATTTFPLLPPQHPPLSLDSRPPAAAWSPKKSAPSSPLLPATAVAAVLSPVAAPAARGAEEGATGDGTWGSGFCLVLLGSADALVLGEAEVFRVAFLEGEPTPPGGGLPLPPALPLFCPGGLFSPSSWGRGDGNAGRADKKG